jgi:hypothetical protein
MPIERSGLGHKSLAYGRSEFCKTGAGVAEEGPLLLRNTFSRPSPTPSVEWYFDEIVK